MNGNKRKFPSKICKNCRMLQERSLGKKLRELQRDFLEIFNGNSRHVNFADSYRNAYHLVINQHGEELYSSLETTMSRHLNEVSKTIENAEQGSFSEQLNRQWIKYKKAVDMIRDILMYMNRTFVISQRKLHVSELGLALWRDHVILSTDVKSRIRDTLLTVVETERTGEVVEKEITRNVIKMLIDLGPPVYQEVFEKPFLEMSATFYRVESKKIIESCNSSDYLKITERYLNEEIGRVHEYLDLQTESKIRTVVSKEMIAVHLQDSGLLKMFLHDQYEDLARICNLLNQVDSDSGLSTTRDVMESRIREAGTHDVTDTASSKKPVEFVQSLLDMKDKYEKIISLAFKND